MKLKDISSENRPRERMERFGVGVLSDAELLAVIIQKGTRKENVINLSHKLLTKFNLTELSKCSIKELQQIKGIGLAKACQIVAVFELNIRQDQIQQKDKIITSAKEVYNYCHAQLNKTDKETFIVLHLNSKNKIIKEEIVSIGTINKTVVHPREIFKSAIKENANSIILVHNHPSGDPEPSEEDIFITEKLFEAGELLLIKILDHVIIGTNKWYSFKESKLIIQ